MNNYINDEIDVYLLEKDRERTELTHSIAHQIALCVNESSEFTDFVQNKVCDIAMSLKEEFENTQRTKNLEITRKNIQNTNFVIPF